MKKNLLLLAGCLLAFGFINAQSAEETIFNTEPGEPGIQEVGPAGTMEGNLYSNGDYYNIEGSPNLSVVQTNLGLSTYGFNINQEDNYRIADDWEVTENVLVEQIHFYGYQTGSTTVSTFSEGSLVIWDGNPMDPSSNMIWGDEFNNYLIDSYWSGAYRVLDYDMGDTNRPLMVIELDTPGLTLAPGTYWIDVGLSGTGASGPWMSPIVIEGTTVTGNAVQRVADFEWQPLMDSGAEAQQDIPFEVYGEVMSTSDLLSTSFSIYPNPANNFLNVNAKQPISQIIVYNLTGQEVMKYAPKGQNAALQVSSLPSGTYILKAVIGDTVQTQKFIKK